MKRINLLFILTLLLGTGYAQTLPAGTCGVVYTIDAAGNRTQRTYMCNNGFVAPQSAVQAVQVDALFPNPTTGKFQVTFTQPLNKAQIIICDMAGHTLQQRQESGYIIEMDVSMLPKGVYWIKVVEGKYSIIHKVVKQ